MNIGNKIRELRKQRGITQEQLAESIGISFQAVSFENLLQMMWKLAEYYEENGKVEEAIEETEKALNLISITKNTQFDTYVKYFNKQIERLKNKI